MGVLLFVIFDRAPAGPPIVGSATTSDAPGSVQAVGRYLFTNQLVNLELAGLILAIEMGGAILIARAGIVRGVATRHNPELLLWPATPVDHNPHRVSGYR